MRVRNAGCALLLLLFAGAVSAQAPTSPPGFAGIAVAGNVEHPRTFMLAELRALPVHDFVDDRAYPTRGDGTHVAREPRHYTGALLKDLLDATKPVERQRFDLRKSIVIVTATDGYKAVFSWSELYLTATGDGVVLVYSENDAPLAANEGPVALESLRDSQPGPRHVKWVRSIEFRTLAN